MENLTKVSERPEKFEMSIKAKMAIKLFHKINETEDRTVRLDLVRRFYEQLISIVQPAGQFNTLPPDEHLENVIIEHKGENCCLWVAGGTAGQRIYFNNESLNSENGLKSSDKKVRWMYYPKPEGKDWVYGEIPWTRFYNNFGTTEVDLFQDLEETD